MSALRLRRGQAYISTVWLTDHIESGRIVLKAGSGI